LDLTRRGEAVLEKDLFAIAELARLDRIHQRRFLRRLESSGSHRLVFQGQELINFSSNDYLELSEDSRVRDAAKAAVDRYAASAASSRLICGNYGLLEDLELALAELKRKNTALVFSSGYLANVGIIPALAEAEDQIFSDELNHASLIDGCRLSKAQVFVFRHRDLNHLEALLRAAQTARRRLLVTDAIFSMDGDVADLPGLVNLAERYGCLLMVDEAHSTGVLGAGGRGIRQHYVDLGLIPPGKDCIDIDMGTLSKALGSQGGYIACSHPIRDFLVNKCRSFIFDTALAPGAAGAALEALRILGQEPERRQQLIRNQELMRRELGNKGVEFLNPSTPIFPVVLQEELTTMRVCENLLKQGCYVQGIRPPSVPAGRSRLRITVGSGHREEEIRELGRHLESAFREEGIPARVGSMGV
jgi:8-amino-7-oxononanoate synthase